MSFFNKIISNTVLVILVLFVLFAPKSVFSQSNLSLQGVIDFTTPSFGNTGKAIHVKALQNIADLSIYGIGVANNGGGSDGEEYNFDPISVLAGEDILVARDVSVISSYFSYCFSEFDHVLQANTNISQNGDDAIELFMNGLVVETFGDVNVDGTGEPWEYLDSWAYKINSGTTGSFVLSDWSFGGINCTDGSTTIYDASCLYPICPLKTYVPDDNFENYLESNGMGDGIAFNDSVLTSNINTVTNLQLLFLSITDLTGIEDFMSLTNLNTEGNSNLTAVDISQNTLLVDARFNQCNLNSLDVSNNPLLSILAFGGNNVSSIDVSNNPLLTNLDCWNNSISTLDLSQNTALTSINCNSNQISSLDFTNNPNMINISCNSNLLTTLDVTNLSLLQILWCPGNNISVLDLSQNSQLNTIRCENNTLHRLDVKNGNNTNVTQFFSTGNPSLECINVDDSTYSANNWTNIDSQQYFGESCYCTLNIDSQTNVSCYGGYDGALVLSGSGGSGFYNYALGFLNQFTGTLIPFTNTGTGFYALPISLTGVPANCYTAVMTDSLGCADTTNICVTQPDSIYSITTMTQCNQVIWNFNLYNSSGTYSSVLTTSNGCDSTAILNVTLIYSDTSYTNDTACNSYTWNGATYTTSGSYFDVSPGSNGCDSIAILNLIIDNSPITSTVTVTSCDSYDWDGVTYTSTGQYTNVYSSLNGCDSTVTLDLTINNSSLSTVTVTSCDSYDWDGVTYTSTGQYTNVYTGLNSCDSTVTLDLTVNQTDTSFLTVSACDSFTLNNVSYDQSGLYYQTISADSLTGFNYVGTYNGSTYYISENPEYWSVAQSNSLLAGGNLVCISDANENDFVSNILPGQQFWLGYTDELVEGNFVWVDGASNSYTKWSPTEPSNSGPTGNEDYTLINSGEGGSNPFDGFWNDVDDNLNQYLYVLELPYSHLTSNGCDSVIALNLTINVSDTSYTNITACDSIEWNGEWYDSSGTYYSVSNNLSSNSLIFDGSSYVSISDDPSLNWGFNNFSVSVWVNKNNSSPWLQTIISKMETTSGNYVGWNLGLVYNQIRFTPGVGTVNGTWVNNGTINSSFTLNDNQWYYITGVFDGTNSQTHLYVDGILIASETANYTINPNNSQDLKIGAYMPSGAPSGPEFFYGNIDNVEIWNRALDISEIQNYMSCSPIGSEQNLLGLWNFEEGSGNTVYDQTSNGNDGTINGASYDTNVPIQSCQLTNINGCDSVSVLNLTINQSDTSYTNITACDSIEWNGEWYDSSGTYYYNSGGVANTNSLSFDGNDDYIQIPDASVNNLSSGTIMTWVKLNDNTSETILCKQSDGENTYATLSIGSYANSSGHGSLGDPGKVYFHSKNFNPIGSSTNLVSNGIYTHVAVTFNQDSVSFYIDGQFSGTTLGNFSIPNDLTVTYTRLGFYNVLGSYNLDGRLDDVSIWSSMLTQAEIQDYINCSPLGNETNLVAFWNFNEGSGNTVFDQSLNGNDGSIFGPFYNTNVPLGSCQLTNSNGCDSVAVLNLTINNSSTNTVSVTACDSYAWDGVTYTTTGQYTNVYTGLNGCDSIVSLDLIINNSSTNTVSIISCDSYAWDGVTYTSTGLYTNMFTDANGCDSTVTLDLTINYSSTNTLIVTACDIYDWDGFTYTTTGQYTNLYTDANGCDSTVIIDLIINNSVNVYDTITICNGDSLIVGGSTYTSSGTYIDTLITNTGCDSIINTNIIVNNIDIIQNDTTICYGDSIILGVSGGTVNFQQACTLNELPTNLQSGLVGYWPFCGNANDESGNGYNGNVNGATLTQDRFNNSNSAYAFDGTSSEISITDTLLSLSNDYTISCWMKSIDITKSRQCLFNSVPHTGFALIYNHSYSPGTMLNAVGPGYTGIWDRLSGGTYNSFQNNTWYHIVFVKEGIQFKTYVDSIIDWQDNVSESLNYIEDVGLNIGTIGMSFSNPEFFKGSLDDFGIWNRALTSQEIQQLYSTSSSPDILWSTGDTTSNITVSPSQTTTYFVSQTLNGVLCFDSVTVTVLDTFINSFSISSCDSYVWDGVTYTSSGQYVNIYTASNGCDSTVTIDLIINNSSSSTVTITSCDSYDWDGLTYTSTGQYTNLYTDINGCDSTVTLDLTINNSYLYSDTVTACDSYVFSFYNGLVYDSSGIYTDTLTTINGCDSIINLVLSINYSYSNIDTVSACSSYVWYGQTYFISGEYDTLFTTSNGCDSLFSLNLTVANNTSSLDTVVTCDSYDWNGNTYYSSGYYDSLFINYVGCDSLAMLFLTINQSDTSYSNITSCDSVEWNGTWYNSSGTYYFSANNSNNLLFNDSLLIDQFTMPVTSYFSHSMPLFDSTKIYRMFIDGRYGYADGWSHNDACYNYAWDTINGIKVFCNGTQHPSQSIPWMYDGFSNFSRPDNDFHNNCCFCSGNDKTYCWTIAGDHNIHTIEWNDGGNYGDNTGALNFSVYEMQNPITQLNTINGCDSVAVLNLIVNNSSTSTVTVTSCDSFDWDGVTYTITGQYTNVYTALNGCDSTVTLDLTINNSSTSLVTVTSCDSFDWDGVTYTTTGQYTNVYTALNGCDSTVTLDLTINNSSSSIVVVSVCGFYIWDGVTYNSTGLYTNLYTALNGCDSTVTLDLTINNSSTSTLTITSCDSYDWDGVTYDSTGFYSNIYVDINGCDSTVNLDLTILYSSFSILIVNACDSFIWDGIVYDTTGNYTNIYNAQNGCDSLVTLDLYISSPTLNIDTNSICTGDSVIVGNSIYYISGNYLDTVVSTIGCDSIYFNTTVIILPSGCTDTIALNYDSLAQCEDFSCIMPIYGCLDTSAINYYSGANYDDGSCIYAGCTDSTANNFNPNATIDDGSCVYTLCLNPSPNGLYTNNITDHRVTINWMNMNSNDCMVWKYYVRYREIGTNTWITKSAGVGSGLCNVGLNTITKVLKNLSPSTTYEYKMKAFYCGGTESSYSQLSQFTTEDPCPEMSNLSTQTFYFNPNKVRFSWDTTGLYTFARIVFRIDTSGSSWQNVGGYGIYYPSLSINKYGLNAGQFYRAQGRTFCDSNITSYRSWWTPPIFWQQPSQIKLNGGEEISELDIYPNPSRDLFNISFNSQEIQDLEVRIISLLGKEIYKEDLVQFVGEYTKSINLNEFEKSVYFLEIITDNGIINKKLILQ